MKGKDQLMDELNLLRKKVVDLERDNRHFKETEKTGEIGGWQFDPTTLIQTWTDEVFRILEIDLDQGAPEVPQGLEFIDPGFRPMAENAIQGAMERGKPYNQEWIVTTAKGNKKWVNAVCKPKKKNGKVVIISGSFQDITSKKIAEEELKKSEERIKIILDNSPFPVAVVDEKDNNILFWSKSAIQLFGHNPKTTEEWYELAYPNPEYRQDVIERWKPFLETAQNSTKAVNTGEYEIHCKNGNIKTCELYAQFIPGSLIVTLNDITERKKSEEQLKALNQQLIANEQQHRAANQQLQAGEQQLKAAVKQLQASEQQLAATNQQLQANEQQLRAANQQLKANEKQLINAKEKAEENELQLKAILNNSPTGFAINRISTGEVTYINKAFTDAYYIPKELCSKVSTFFEYVYRDQMDLGNKILSDVKSEDPERMKWEMVPVKDKKTESIHYVSASNIILKEIDLMISTVINITSQVKNENELKFAKEKAEESEEQLKRIANNFGDGMIYQVAMLDETNRKFNYVSDAVVKLYGCTPEQAKENPDLIYGKLHPDDVGEFIKVEKEALKKMTTFRTECRVINPDGSVRWSYYVSQPRIINDIVCWDGIEVDITKQKQIEVELTKAKEKAQESDRLKSAFLANMSHEIRTPMNGILGFTNLLQQPNLTGEKQQKYIDIIQKSGDRMLNTVNDIIDISRIESGMVELSISEVNINEQLKYLHSFFSPEALKKGIQLIINNDISDQDIRFITDLKKFNSIVTNLIKNAIKFTNLGFIKLGYNIENKNGSAELKFYVKDSGIGIPKDRQKFIFDRFVQVDIEGKQAQQGSGLGLAISKAYVEMLGGKIWVDSEEGKGTTFYFTIQYHPVSQSNSITEIDEQILKEDNIKEKFKILVVEDDEASRDLISIVVEKFAKEIIEVNCGSDAIEVCRNNADIDLILMDIQLPDMNGYEATGQIRQFNKNVVIFAQTAFALTGEREKAIKMGCNDYISKPINNSKLHELIKQYLRN